MVKYWLWISIAIVLILVLMSDEVKGAIDPYAWRDDGGWDDPTFNLPQGGLGSGKVVLGGAGGDWDGSMQRALWFGYQANEFLNRYAISSQKRTWNVGSDHYNLQLNSYAVDIATSGEEGDRVLKHLMDKFGDSFTGGLKNVYRGGYRFQFIWRYPDHYDHIHIGVKKIY